MKSLRRTPTATPRTAPTGHMTAMPFGTKLLFWARFTPTHENGQAIQEAKYSAGLQYWVMFSLPVGDSSPRQKLVDVSFLTALRHLP